MGRNDPCPCGSGKKYKVCCLNKPKDAIDLIESSEERGRWLKNYPYTGQEKMEGRLYLEDYFDSTCIEVDKILYLAFQKCIERMEKEHISSFAEYDEKYSIHYRCKEWLNELCVLL